ncbi:LiaI-LiaF-like domain-containing protein [Mucilaginibacter pocheonensis]|uniref:LiaI-LiaF-like transmembrane region domain-containing protein n=1 Tax=Mucilaginibacter pocheonensis TaxID=398050 RepID=A0ABU1T4J6_9SPHI|nr:DUF5668 domain-containing protein [Mucilaginibacter pocheonensis]MDR6940314.1 hypothetical protein [Mucilaginibacter pocheonensis]
MRNDKLVPGAILVCIGAIFLLNNFGYIDFHWMNVIHLWPIFLIMGGVNLVFANNRTAWATILKLSVVILGFGLLLFGHFERYSFWPGRYNFHYNDDNNNDNNDSDDDDDSDSSGTDHGVVKIEGSSVFNKEYTPDAKLARLNVSGGGTTYTLNDTTSQLFKAETKEFYGKYEFNSSKEDSVYVLDLKMKNNKGWHFDSDENKSNMANIKLNPNPVWDINVQTGATKLDFDLSKFKIKNLTLKGGAASFDVKLGNPLASTNVEVSTGVSEVNINVPKEAACSIRTNSGLSSNEFAGFDKKDDNRYETPGFDAAKTKIYIHMSGGVSDFKVNRY